MCLRSGAIDALFTQTPGREAVEGFAPTASAPGQNAVPGPGRPWASPWRAAEARSQRIAYSRGVVGRGLSRNEAMRTLPPSTGCAGILGRTEVAGFWDEPSVIARYSVGGLAAHAVHGVVWLEQLLTDAEPVGLRPVDVGEFFGANRVDREADEEVREDAFSASLRAAAEGFARTGINTVRAALMQRATSSSASWMKHPTRVPLPSSGSPVGRSRSVSICGLGCSKSWCTATTWSAACPVWSRQILPEPRSRSPWTSASSWPRPGWVDSPSLRGFTRSERALPGALRVL